MIDARELRLGNKFKQPSDETIFEVLALHNNRVAYAKDDYTIDNEYFWFDVDHILPIPLTSELLRGIGFKNDKQGNTRLYNSRRGKYFTLYLSESFGKEPDGNLYYGDSYTRNVKLKYLHQLQNLYFVLTGQELKVNLNHTAPSQPH